MPAIDIRDAHPEDAAIIAEFNTRMAMETEERPLAPDLINAGVAAVLHRALGMTAPGYVVMEVDFRKGD